MSKHKTRLKKVLDKCNMTVPTLELRTGISRNHLYSYCAGTRTPNAENIYKITLALPGMLDVRDFMPKKKAEIIEKTIKLRASVCEQL